MGQIKNIKLHIVTDIKVNITLKPILSVSSQLIHYQPCLKQPQHLHQQQNQQPQNNLQQQGCPLLRSMHDFPTNDKRRVAGKTSLTTTDVSKQRVKIMHHATSSGETGTLCVQVRGVISGMTRSKRATSLA